MTGKVTSSTPDAPKPPADTTTPAKGTAKVPETKPGGDGPPSPEIIPAAERLADAERAETENLTPVSDMSEEDMKEEISRLRRDNAQMRDTLRAAGKTAAGTPYKPSFLMSEGVRLDLLEHGKSVDPMTGDLFTRDAESGQITRCDKRTGEETDVTGDVPDPR